MWDPRPLPAQQKWRSQGAGAQSGGMEKRGDAGEPSVKTLWGATLGGGSLRVRSGAGLWGLWRVTAVVAPESQPGAQAMPLPRGAGLGEGLRHSCLRRPSVRDAACPLRAGPPSTTAPVVMGGLSEKLLRVKVNAHSRCLLKC